jgi:DNA-binding Lrp family transcriptional regulator
VKLDLKDCRILNEIEFNARSTISSVAKKVKLSKEVVNYRIKRLEKNKIIDGYRTLFNIFELNEIEPRENNKPIYIVYHIATVNDKWVELTSSSYIKLLSSGILNDPNLKSIKISYLGEKENIPILKQIWNHPKVEIIDFGDNVKLYDIYTDNIINTLFPDFKKYINVTNSMLTGLENKDLEYVDEIIDGDLKYYYYKVLENCDNSQLPKSFNDDYKKFRNFRMRNVE